MTDRDLALIAVIQGQIYLIGCFVFGLVQGNHVASIVAIASAGISYLSTTCFRVGQDWESAANAVSFAAMVLGIIAGCLLL